MVGQFPAGVKIRIRCLNLALSGAQKWAEMLHHPSIHFWVLLKKLSILSIDRSGRKLIFSPSTYSKKIYFGRLRRPLSGTFQPISRGGGGRGGVGVKGPLPASPP